MNQQYPSFLQIKTFTPTDRRMFFHSQTYKGQKIALRCQPTVISVFSDKRQQFCNYCLSQKSLQKCNQCQVYYYCSVDCQKNDWKQHKNECKFLKLLNRPNIPSNILMLIRIYMNQMDVSQLLVGDFNEQNNEIALMMLHYLKEYGNKDCDDLKQLIEIQSKIAINAFSNGDYIGVYQPANYFNHSCFPNNNCIHVFNKRRLLILFNNKFKKQFNQDEFELTLCYYNEPDKNIRLKFLQEQYAFVCKCQICCDAPLASVNLEESELIEIIKKGEDASDQRYLKAFEDLYLKSLEEKKYKKALVVLEFMLKYYKEWLNNDIDPILGMKLMESGKLCEYLGHLEKGYKYRVMGEDIMKTLEWDN